MAVIVLGVATWQTWDHVGSGEPAPEFFLDVLDQPEPISNASLEGRPTLLYFWAPWCGVCGATSENVDAVQEAVGDSANVLSVALSYKSPDELRKYMQDNGATYPVLLGDEKVRRDFAVNSFPTFYILDTEGNVDSSVVGYTTTLGLRARLWKAR